MRMLLDMGKCRSYNMTHKKIAQCLLFIFSLLPRNAVMKDIFAISMR